MQNGFVHFRDHDSTQSGKYYQCLLDHYPIHSEDKQKIFSPLVVTGLTMLLLLDFIRTHQLLIRYNWLPSLHVSISKPHVNDLYHRALLYYPY